MQTPATEPKADLLTHKEIGRELLGTDLPLPELENLAEARFRGGRGGKEDVNERLN